MEKKKGYSMFERDKLDPADSMRIERNIYFEEQTADLSGLTALPLEQLQALREEYAAAEQAAFEALQEQAAAWDEQAGKTLAIDKAIEYVRTPEATHTANQWEATDYGKHISNRVYQMRYHISENTRYDREKEKSIPYSWTLSWSIYTNSPHNYGQAKIAGQERKVFADKACGFPCRPQQSSFMRLWKASALPQTIRRIFSSTGILLRRTAPLTCRFPLSKAQAWTS